MTSWFEFFCRLKPTLRIGSGSTLGEFRYRSMSDIVFNWPWATFLELPHYSLFMSTGPGCALEGLINLYIRVSFLQLELEADL